MIRYLVSVLHFLMHFCILFAVLLVFLLATQPGLNTLIDLSRLYLPGTLKTQRVEGTLLDSLIIHGIKYDHQEVQLKIAQLTIQWHPSSFKKHSIIAKWQNIEGNLSATQTIKSSLGTLSTTTNLPHLNVTLDSKIKAFSPEQWQLKANILGTYPWNWNFDVDLLQTDKQKKTGLNANLSAKGLIKNKNQGNLTLTLHPGHYQLDDASLPSLEFKGGSINFTLSSKQLLGKGILSIDSNKNLNVEIHLPKVTLDGGLQPHQAINSKILLTINSLDFLQNISPEIDKLKGQLTALLYVNGTLDNIRIKSQLALSKTSLFIPKIGLNLDNIDLKLDAQEKNWTANGIATTSGRSLLLKGNGTINKDYKGDLSLEGTDFPLIKTNEYQINVSPQLKLHLEPDVRSISGSILIPSAQIKPQSFTNSQTLPDEVIYKKDNITPSKPLFDSNMEINIQMGENVEVNTKGLKGHLVGTLNVKQQSPGPINAYGELSIVDGTYKAYGKELAIKQGQLIFTGGNIDNPGINIRAAKKINNTSTYSSSAQLFNFNNNNLQSVNLGDTIILGVEVNGRLSNPKIQLFSEPAILSQADILSMLILGRPANQANKAGGQLLLAAILSMNFGGTNSTQLLEQLKQTSGFDFDVQTNTNYNQTTNTVTDSTAFVVGKSLSKRLYLSYNIGLSQSTTNMLTLKYILNKFFSIQISNSVTSNAIDFLYTSNKKVGKNKTSQDKTHD